MMRTMYPGDVESYEEYVALRYAKKHDVSGEKRDEVGKWTTTASPGHVKRMKHIQGIFDKSLDEIQASGKPLSPETKKRYQEAFKRVFAAISPKAASILKQHLHAFVFFEDAADLNKQLFGTAKSWLFPNEARIQGVVLRRGPHGSADVCLSGGHKQGDEWIEDGILAHEIAHVIDRDMKQGFKSVPNFCNDKEWKAAYEAELKDGQLSEYAATDFREGFAEFGRAVLLHPKEAKKFPKCHRFWKKKGIIK